MIRKHPDYIHLGKYVRIIKAFSIFIELAAFLYYESVVPL